MPRTYICTVGGDIMSYDIYLKDRVSGETIMLPIKHVMTGGTYQAEYNPETKTFSPAAIRDAWLNITYNYGRYYYEAAEGDDRFYVEESGEYDNLGIRGIYGTSGLESINMLKDLASRIEMKYKKGGEWINTIRKKTVFKDINGNDVDILKMHFCEDDITKEEISYEISEGPNTNYWEATAANAMKPLFQLIAMAELRPDGIWDGD